MIRRTAAISIALITLLSLSACSSSDDPKQEGDGTTTTVVTNADGTGNGDGSSTTVEGGEAPEGDPDVAPPSKMDLTGFIAGSGGAISADDEGCILAGLSDDPTLSDFAAYDDLQSEPQTTREAFYTIVLDCVGFDRASALFMKRYAETSTYNEVELGCVGLTVSALANEDVVALLVQDEAVTQILADDVQTNCFEPDTSE